MKRTACAVLMMVVLATPAFAARVYLKEGGFIQAKKVWRSGGKVHLLVNRDILTAFETTEVDIKRTFVKGRRSAKKPGAAPRQTVETAPGRAATPQKPAVTRSGISLPERSKLPMLPKLSEKNPDSLIPSSDSGSTIKQHKKDMAEKLAE